MSTVQKTIDRFRRRRMANGIIRSVGRGLAAALLLSLVLLLADRLFALDVPRATFAVVVALGAAAGGARCALVGPPKAAIRG